MEKYSPCLLRRGQGDNGRMRLYFVAWRREQISVGLHILD